MIVLWCLRVLVVWRYRILCAWCDNILTVSIRDIRLKLSKPYWSTYIWLEISHAFTAWWCVRFSQCSFPRIRPLIVLFGQFMLDLLLCLDKLSVFHQTLMLCLFDSFHYTVELSLRVWSWLLPYFFVIWIPLLSLLMSTWGFRLFLLFYRILLGSVLAFGILRVFQRLIDLRYLWLLDWFMVIILLFGPKRTPNKAFCLFINGLLDIRLFSASVERLLPASLEPTLYSC